MPVLAGDAIALNRRRWALPPLLFLRFFFCPPCLAFPCFPLLPFCSFAFPAFLSFSLRPPAFLASLPFPCFPLLLCFFALPFLRKRSERKGALESGEAQGAPGGNAAIRWRRRSREISGARQAYYHELHVGTCSRRGGRPSLHWQSGLLATGTRSIICRFETNRGKEGSARHNIISGCEFRVVLRRFGCIAEGQRGAATVRFHNTCVRVQLPWFYSHFPHPKERDAPCTYVGLPLADASGLHHRRWGWQGPRACGVARPWRC